MGNGMVIDPTIWTGEINKLREQGDSPITPANQDLWIAPPSSCPTMLDQDGLEEVRLSKTAHVWLLPGRGRMFATYGDAT